MQPAGSERSLVFVYNADSGILNMLKDGVHKLLSPSTYPCRLCDLTWSVLGERRRWRTFVGGLPVTAEFLHRDEFIQRFPDIPPRPPNVYRLTDGRPHEVIDRDMMRSLASLDELEAAVQALTD